MSWRYLEQDEWRRRQKRRIEASSAMMSRRMKMRRKWDEQMRR